MGKTPVPESQQFPRKIALLKDGFWEETAIYQTAEGPVVRKASKDSNTSGPWARKTLQTEIRYLQELPDAAAKWFPPLLRAWGDQSDPSPTVGYEIPFYEDHLNLAQYIAQGKATPEHGDRFQTTLAKVLFEELYAPVERSQSLASHLLHTLGEAANTLGQIPPFRDPVTSQIEINGRTLPGLQCQLRRLSQSGLARRLDQITPVRLHGDLILENILVPVAADRWWERLLLIDPVSVAGIHAGPPLFDLVKYESYASGELLAIRSQTCTAEAVGPGRYRYAWDHRSPALAPYHGGRWHGTFRRHFEERHGPMDRELYHLLDAYFSLVMAVNTSGKQQRARLLKSLLALGLVFP